MPGQQGQYTAADLATAPQQGQYSLADIAPTPAPPKGFTDHVKDAIGEWWNQVNPVEGIKGMAQAANHPIDTLNALGSAQGALLDKAEQAFKAGKPVEGVRHVLNYLVPIVGTQTDKAGDQMDAGNYGAGLGTTAGVATNIAAPELIKGVKLPSGGQAFAQRMYQSALKPSLASNSAAEIKTMVQTGLDNGIPVSAGGAQKLSGLIDDLNSKVKAQIASNPNAPINKYAVSGRLADVANKFETQVNPEKDLQIVANSGNEFLRNQPSDIGAANAQDLKVGTYKQLQAKYGELKTAQIESEKALARGLKEELEVQFPEIKGLNASESKLIGLNDALQGAVKRIQNRNLVGLTPPLVTAGLSGALGMMGGGTEAGAAALAGGLLHYAIEDPFVKSRLASALNRATKGSLPVNAAAARIATYSNALGNSLKKNPETPQEQTSQSQQ